MINGNVILGDETRVESHVIIDADTGSIRMGKNNRVFAGAVLGGPPQDLSYAGEDTQLVIGDNNVFREFSSANRGSTKTEKGTQIGSNNYFMSYTHIGHDCDVHDHVVIANNTQLGGHCEVGSRTVISAMVGVTQFSRIGQMAFIAGGSEVNKDIPPFTIAEGKWAVCRSSNKIGMSRAGIEKSDIDQVHRAIRILLMDGGTIEECLKKIHDEVIMNDSVETLIEFIKNSKKGIARQ